MKRYILFLYCVVASNFVHAIDGKNLYDIIGLCGATGAIFGVLAVGDVLRAYLVSVKQEPFYCPSHYALRHDTDTPVCQDLVTGATIPAETRQEVIIRDLQWALGNSIASLTSFGIACILYGIRRRYIIQNNA